MTGKKNDSFYDFYYTKFNTILSGRSAEISKDKLEKLLETCGLDKSILTDEKAGEKIKSAYKKKMFELHPNYRTDYKTQSDKIKELEKNLVEAKESKNQKKIDEINKEIEDAKITMRGYDREFAEVNESFNILKEMFKSGDKN